MAKNKQAGFTVIEALISLVVLVIIGFAGWHVYRDVDKASIQTNRWIGSTSNYNWSDASNWSLGIPKDGQNLQINVSSIKGYAQAEVALKDNIPNLSVHALIFKVSSPADDLLVDGDTLAVTSGISELATYKNTTGYVGAPSVSLNNNIVLKGNQTVSIGSAANESPSLSIGSLGATSMNIGDYTIQFTAPTGSNVGVDIGAHIVGSGNLYFDGGSSVLGSGESSYANPHFTGTVHILGGAIASAWGNGDLGTAAITVDNGGTLELNGTNATTFSLANSMTISGNGVATSSRTTGTGTGASLGAITTCITSVGEGCASAHVTLTGQITLLDNTELGETPNCEGSGYCQIPDPYIATYTITKPMHGSYSVAAVPGSNTKIITDK